MKSTLNQRDDPASAVVSINPANGAIRAMTAVVPGRRRSSSTWRGGRRQSGSSFKTFVLTEAIRQGINPYTTRYLSAPLAAGSEPRPGTWPRTATRTSARCRSPPRPSAPTTRSMRASRSTSGRERRQVAKRMGIETELLPVASIGLGSNAVSVLEMASASPRSRRRASTPSRWRFGGSSWPTAPSTGTPAGASPSASAFFPTVSPTRSHADPAEQHHRRYRNRCLLRRSRGGGKTGTTDSSADAWFAGYTRRRPPSSGSDTRTPRSP